MSIYSIARTAGVSPSSVSLALRDSPKISAATKRRVRRIARLQGYRPDARLNELMARMRLSSALRGRACFAVVSLYGEAQPWRRSAHHARIYASMAARADELGYRLEPLWMRAPGMTYRRFRSILDARGIEGILCFGSPDADDDFPPELGDYAIVTQGMSIRTPLHRVTGNFFNDVLHTLEEVRRRGYRRPGLVISRYEDARSTHAYVGAYLGWCECNLGAGLPVLRLDGAEDGPLLSWLRRWRPDVAVVVHGGDSLGRLASCLGRRGIRVPGDLGIAAITQILGGTGLSGLEENQRLIGRWAVELLADRIANRDFGFPASPRVEMVESLWVDGGSLRR